MELGELERLLDRIMEECYFSGDILNSEGRKLLERIVKIALKNSAPINKMVYKVRRDPTRFNVSKLRQKLLEWISDLRAEPEPKPGYTQRSNRN